MTYEQFWEQDCDLVKYYRKAAQIRNNVKNQDAWLQGAYFYEALIDIAPILNAGAKKGTKARPYIKEPFDLFSQHNEQQRETVEQKNDKKARAFMEAFSVAVNKKYEEKGGDADG